MILKIITLKQRNYFKIGDTLEFFGPNLDNTLYFVEEIFDQDGNSLDAARHPKQLIKLTDMDFQLTDVIIREAFAKTGYIGTVAGVNLYTKKDATEGTIIVATREAVTIFNKKGVEMEQERDANTRVNSAYSRKYYVVALTNESKAIKITLGESA